MGERLTVADEEALAEEFPDLISSVKRQVVWGTLRIACSHVLESGEIRFDAEGPNFIEDTYEVRIDFTQTDHFGYPIVFEESGRIVQRAEIEGIDPTDLHINKDDHGSCCLGIFPDFHWKSSCDFIRDLVIPFFYWQSFRAKNGEAPWEEFQHGDEGLSEAMAMNPRKVKKGGSRNVTCPCGSGRKYKKCCLRRDEKLLGKFSDKLSPCDHLQKERLLN